METIWLPPLRSTSRDKTRTTNKIQHQKKMYAAFKCHSMKCLSPYILVELGSRYEDSSQGGKAGDFRIPEC